jgi:hypothetical protein
MRALKIAVLAAALGAAAAFTGSASNAMPVGRLAAASNELASDMVQDVRWRGRARFQPYYYSPYYAYYGWPYYRPYWGLGWGWGRWWW